MATATAAGPTAITPRLASARPEPGLRVAGLFAGVGGIEQGPHRAGHQSILLNEIEPGAQAVLRARFPGIDLTGDVCDLRSLPDVNLVAAGFPCQDLSQAGRTIGIGGSRSGLVGQVFRLLETADPRWLLLENVPFMLQLERGRAMQHLTTELGRLGFRWAYRVVDARSFGMPSGASACCSSPHGTLTPVPFCPRTTQGSPRSGIPSAWPAASIGPRGSGGSARPSTPSRPSRGAPRSVFRHRPRSGCPTAWWARQTSATPSGCRASPRTGRPSTA